MHIDSTFSVVAPISQVWDTLMDFERVAGCLPGARILNKLSDDAYQVGMTVKLGPVTMQYKGLLNVIERNAPEHRAVLGGKAQERPPSPWCWPKTERPHGVPSAQTWRCPARQRPWARG
jgi:carbon monoxide dehydrogenase subunit G